MNPEQKDLLLRFRDGTLEDHAFAEPKNDLYARADELAELFKVNNKDATKIDPTLVEIAKGLHCMAREDYNDFEKVSGVVKDVFRKKDNVRDRVKPIFFD